MKILIILNGECSDCTYLFNLAEKYDGVICADGGYKHIKGSDIKPLAVMGDFDSCERPESENTIKYPAEKNETDCEIAIEYARKMNASEITLTCALGGRTDHLMANILLLSRYKEINIKEKQCDIYCIDSNTEINNSAGKTISLIPIENSYIRLRGFKYPLDKYVETGTTLTLSNIVDDEEASIEIKSGKCILIINHTI